MRVRRIAFMIDGGFFLKCLPKTAPSFSGTPQGAAEAARILCKRHVKRLTGSNRGWLDHVYRVFYYDALPFEGKLHHPVTNRQIDFSKSTTAIFRRTLLDELRRKRKFALRLGEVARDPSGDWAINPKKIKKIIATYQFHERFAEIPPDTDDTKKTELARLEKLWREFTDADVTPTFRQKGVDMRLGIDVASITLKQQADTIILVTGDSDFVPAAKLARREGVEVILDPMWRNIRPDLHEHIDGLASVLGGQAGQPDDATTPEED